LDICLDRGIVFHSFSRRRCGVGGHDRALSPFLRDAAGQVRLRLKTLWRDNITDLMMSPIEHMKRLSAFAQIQRLAAYPSVHSIRTALRCAALSCTALS